MKHNTLEVIHTMIFVYLLIHFAVLGIVLFFYFKFSLPQQEVFDLITSLSMWIGFYVGMFVMSHIGSTIYER